MKTDARGALLALSLLIAACGEAGPTAEITAQRTASHPSRPVLAGATARDRFQPLEGFMPHAAQDERPAPVAYELPSGWKLLAATPERVLNVQPGGEADAACYLSIMPPSALEANVNRWRKQFGAAPLAASEISGLPGVELLGGKGTLVEVEGTFAGMGDMPPRAGFKLLGIALCEPERSVFLKFTAPADVVEREREHFLAFASSLQMAAPAAGDVHAEGAPERSAPAPAADGGGALSWHAPASWTQQPDRPMREVSFALANGAECYITRLAADAGGLRPNIDRWCKQLGREPLDDAAFAALEKVSVLGQTVPVLDLEGTFTGMDGVPRTGQGLLGVACIRAGDSVFVKLIGPEPVVRAEHANFVAFVKSLGEHP